jgi:hypothetical protein
MAKDRFGFLKGTTAEDAEFHRLRIMFCLKDGVVKVAKAGLLESHLEWFESEGWLAKTGVGEFLEKSIRGFYLPNSNELYCYKGVGWYFDDRVLEILLKNIGGLKKALGLNNGTKLYLGPKDAVINGVPYKQVFIGTLKNFELRPECSNP